MTLYVEGDKVRTLDCANGVIRGTVVEAEGNYVHVKVDDWTDKSDKIQLHINDIGFQDPKQDDLIHEDMRGLMLTHYVMAERMMQYDTYMILKSIKDYNDHDTLCHILGDGFVGYHKMDNDQLIAEWNDSEDGWYGAYQDGELPWTTFEDDPINTLEQDETGEVAHASRKGSK